MRVKRDAVTVSGCVRVVLRAEGGDDHRVELVARAAAELLERGRGRQRLAVGARRGHGVVGDADGDHARAERDRLADQPVGVAGAVEALVAGAHEARDRQHGGRGGQDALADDRDGGGSSPTPRARASRACAARPRAPRACRCPASRRRGRCRRAGSAARPRRRPTPIAWAATRGSATAEPPARRSERICSSTSRTWRSEDRRCQRERARRRSWAMASAATPSRASSGMRASPRTAPAASRSEIEPSACCADRAAVSAPASTGPRKA